MKHKTYPTDLTDRQWDCISPHIPLAKPGGRPRTLDMREVINAFLYVVVSGCQWRMVPYEYPKWQSVYSYYARWRDDGSWQRIHDTLRAEVRRTAGRHKHPTAGCLDSQSVKTSSMAAERGFDKGKTVNGRKRHVLMDTMGLVMGLVVTAASLSDAAGARLLFKRMGGGCKNIRKVWVDGTIERTGPARLSFVVCRAVIGRTLISMLQRTFVIGLRSGTRLRMCLWSRAFGFRNKLPCFSWRFMTSFRMTILRIHRQ